VTSPGTTADALTGTAVPVRHASTLVLVRDGEGHGQDRLEVLMLRRRAGSGFVPGAHVFPGGAVDPEDHDLAVPEGSSFDPRAAARTLAVDEPRLALAHWAAAIRETFEECGALLAHRPDGTHVPTTPPAGAAGRFAEHRRAVERGERLLGDVLASEGLVPALDRLRYLARWITPRGAPRRYDTRFFLAAAPPEQDLSPDGTETTELSWFRPVEALDLHRRGRLQLILPTERTLELLARFPSAADVLDALPALGDGHHLAEHGGGWRVPLVGETTTTTSEETQR
jgi:8-oxo-dGTP pyrophosphatase MutT (NUDIX family)